MKHVRAALPKSFSFQRLLLTWIQMDVTDSTSYWPHCNHYINASIQINIALLGDYKLLFFWTRDLASNLLYFHLHNITGKEVLFELLSYLACLIVTFSVHILLTLYYVWLKTEEHFFLYSDYTHQILHTFFYHVQQISIKNNL